MAMIICNECGREISDKAGNCPHCGCPMETQETKDDILLKEIFAKYNASQKKLMVKELKARTGLTDAECEVVIDYYLRDKTNMLNAPREQMRQAMKPYQKRNSNKKTIKWLGIAFGAMFLIGLIFGGGDAETETETQIADETIENVGNNEIKEQTVEEPDADEEPIVKETAQEESEGNVIEKGGSFDKDGLKITLNDCSADFTDYEDEYGWYKPEEGYKYAMASFTYENTGGSGDSDKYASIYDFECYADGSFCEQEYGLGEEFMNANLSPGRNVSFETYYLVPIDCTEIELEYTANYWTNEKVIIKIQ